MSGDINVLALVKGEDRYIVLFNDENQSEALRTLGRYASNPDLSFSWYDAAVLSQKIRKIAQSKKHGCYEEFQAMDDDAPRQSPVESPPTFEMPSFDDWLNELD